MVSLLPRTHPDWAWGLATIKSTGRRGTAPNGATKRWFDLGIAGEDYLERRTAVLVRQLHFEFRFLRLLIVVAG